MELLESVIFSLLSEEKREQLSPILNALKANDYDIKATFSSLDLKAIMPLILSIFFSQKNANEPNEEKNSSGKIYYENEDSFILNLKEIAGEEIAEIINDYYT